MFLSKSCANRVKPCITWLERGCKMKIVLQNEALGNRLPLNRARSMIPVLANRVVLRANPIEPYVECSWRTLVLRVNVQSSVLQSAHL